MNDKENVGGFMLNRGILTFITVVLSPTLQAQTPRSPAATPAAGPTQQELDSASLDVRAWLSANHDYAGRRFVNLNQITTTNVGALRPVCVYQARLKPSPGR